MNIVDVIILVFVIFALFRGSEIGFVRQLLSTVGFFGGLLLGALLQPHIVQLMHTKLGRSLLSIVITLGLAFIFLAIGEYLGLVLKKKVVRLQVNLVDNFMGVILSGISVLFAAWLSASILSAMPYPGLQADIRSSKIVSSLNGALPPAPNVIADIGHLISPNGFPEVFSGGEPTPPSNAPAPSLGGLQAAVNKDRASVVKIEGRGCGGLVEGSGFVVGNDLVATNAHVVAGISSPYVDDANGIRKATPIWFDPDLDFAVLRVDDLAGKPLVIEPDNVSKNTPAAVLGYPGGGQFEADGATVLDEFTATGRNIYGQGNTQRDVYEINAKVVPGNSGGPLVAKDGSVIGVVFAESTTYKHTGYALTTKQVIAEINQAEAQNRRVGTGGCAE